MQLQRRGSALAAVLAGSVLLLLLCLLAASFSLSQLDFSRRFRDHSLTEQLARAAVTQFIANERKNGAEDDPLGPRGTELTQRYDWQDLFGPDSARLGGVARIGFQAQPGSPFFSLDNSSSALFGHGCLDAPEESSVPPFSTQLLIRVERGSQVCWYECLLKRVWPYVVTTRDPITVAGNPLGGNPKAPSSITGDFLCLPPRGEDPHGTDFLTLTPLQMRALAVQMGIQTEGGVAIGGPYPMATQANRLTGDVDFAFQDPRRPPRVVVAPGSVWDGASRLGVGFRPELLSQILQDASRFPLEYDLLRQVTDSGDPIYRWRNGRPFYFMEQDVLLTDVEPDAPPSGTHVEVGEVFLLEGSLGNSFLPHPRAPADDKMVRIRPTSTLTLHNCRLYVDGDLVLRGDATRAVLVGDNSTLVVRGTLTVEGGALDAGDQGMVIYCRKLLMKASGDYRGLIMVGQSALFYPDIQDIPGPDVALQGFALRGGLVVGGEPVQTAAGGEDPPDGTILTGVDLPSAFVAFRGLCLFSASFTYDPGYLKPLHRYGRFQLVSLRRVP